MSEKMKRFEIIFSENEMRRFTVSNEELLIDVHGMNCRQAMMFLKNVIALIRGSVTLNVIHGYNHGQAIKNMCMHSEKISERIVKTESLPWNPGVTKFIIA